MITNKIKNLILGVFLVTILIASDGISTTQAEQGVIDIGLDVVVNRPYWCYRTWGWNPYWGRTVTVVDPIAQQRESGYSDGHSRGKDDAKHGKLNAPSSHKHYSNSHSLTYREAFLQGYADGYNEQLGRRG